MKSLKISSRFVSDKQHQLRLHAAVWHHCFPTNDNWCYHAERKVLMVKLSWINSTQWCKCFISYVRSHLLFSDWISGTNYYWPLNTLVNGVALGTMPASVTGNVTVTDIMELGRDVLMFASYNAYLNAGRGQGCIVDGKECRDGFSVSLVVKFKKEAATWTSNTFIVDSVGDDSLTTSRGFSIYVNNGKLFAFFATDTRKWSANMPLRTDVWLHVMFTWSPGNGIILYTNGVQK